LRLKAQLVNTGEGLEQVANQLLMKNSFMVVKSYSNFDSASGVVNLNLLYYPIFTPTLRKKSQPTYLLRRSLLNKIFVVNEKSGTKMLKLS
jgi:hypothetical protein